MIRSASLRASVVALLVAGVVPAVGGPAAAAYLPPSEWVVGPHKPVALITLDGQTKVKYLDKILATLRSKRAKASFFVSGEWVSAHPKKVRSIRRAGHSLGNRGWSKTAFTAMDDTSIRASIARAANALNKVGVAPAPFLRTPNGARDTRVLQIAGSMGYRSVRWTHRPGGGAYLRVQRAAIHKAKYGSIISLDVWRKSHRRALPGIIDGLRRRGFALGKIGRLANVHPIRWDVTLQSGSGGSEVAYLQRILKWTSYPSGTVDGSFGYATLQAVYAFEKVHGHTRDGVVPPWQMTEIAMRSTSAPFQLPSEPRQRDHSSPQSRFEHRLNLV